MFVFWGWNRAVYTISDISSRGGGGSFALNSLAAPDIFTSFTVEDYFGLENLIIPQTNARIGCFTKDNVALVLRLDHMKCVKYVMRQNQTVDFGGQIGDPKCVAMVKGGRVDLSDGQFLTFEHTDGPNCANIGIEKYSVLHVSRYFDLNWSCGGGAGAFIPKTNAKLFGFEGSDRLHLAGFGLDMRSL
ncbi:MAG: hypothetical protein FDW93_06670 [Bergeyella sp.]|nr:hypothetical protein [Bergeyella sp.]